jgi:hypothetical protein
LLISLRNTLSKKPLPSNKSTISSEGVKKYVERHFCSSQTNTWIIDDQCYSVWCRSVKCCKTLSLLLVKCFSGATCVWSIPEDSSCVFPTTALCEMKRLLGDLFRPLMVQWLHLMLSSKHWLCIKTLSQWCGYNIQIFSNHALQGQERVSHHIAKRISGWNSYGERRYLWVEVPLVLMDYIWTVREHCQKWFICWRK